MRSMLLATAAVMATTGFAFAADQQLSGTITAAGQKLDGVVVSAKKIGSTITTSVYSDADGNYYFPPLPDGKYNVWAQTLGYQQAKSEVSLDANKHQDLQLTAISDPETRWRQLPGELVWDSLPAETAEDVHMKQIIHNNCNGCHTPSFPFQFRFDANGWSRIIDLMKVIGGGLPQDRPANQIISMNQKGIAAYLGKVRGPNSVMTIKERPRPSGEAARVVWTLYDVPRIEGVGTAALPVSDADNDGTNWALGTPSKAGLIIHDDVMDFDGNVWFTSNSANSIVTVGKVDAKTGEVTYKKVPRANGSGLASPTHGIARDGQGNLWFDVNPGRRSLGKLEVPTGRITVYPTPDGMQPLGGAVTVDVDGKGMVWASAPAGVLRFNPQTAEFTEFKTTMPPAPMALAARTAPPATVTAMAGGRRWPSTPSARPTPSLGK
jgi:hypothetical protein